MEAFLTNSLTQRHLAKGCTKQLLDAGLELTPLDSVWFIIKRKTVNRISFL